MKHNELIAQLRGIAVISVALMHFTAYGFPVDYMFLTCIGNGFDGVVLFFAVSGFLITRNLLTRYRRVASVRLGEFYVMRAARILPCLALAVALLSIISLNSNINGFVFPPGFSVGDAIQHVITLRFNGYYLAGAAATPAWAVLWSISVEETFYVAYPLVAMVLRKEKYLIAAMLAVIVHGPFARANASGLYSYFGCFDLMDMGALAAIAAHRLRESVPSWASACAGIAGAIVALGAYTGLDIHEHTAMAPSLVAFGAALMLFASEVRGFGERSASTLLGRLGSLSYEVYLFHMAIFLLLAQIIQPVQGWLAYLVLAMALWLTFSVCGLVSERFSVPMNALIRAAFTGPSAKRRRAPKVLVAPGHTPHGGAPANSIR